MLEDKCLNCNKRLGLIQKDAGSRVDLTRICDNCWERGIPEFKIPAVKKKKNKRGTDSERQRQYCWEASQSDECSDIKCTECLFDGDFAVKRGEHIDRAQKLRFREWEDKKK